MKTKDASIHDVAKQAGVSIATVSRVLNKRDRVSAETEQAVRRAIRRLKYQPDLRGRALSRRRSDTLGLVLPDFFGDYYGRLMTGVDAEARASQYHLLVSRAAGTSAKCEEVAHMLSSRSVDGVVLMVDRLAGEGLDRLVELGAPLVVLDRDVGHRHLDNVLIDNRTGGRDAAEHLIAEHGIERLLFLGGPRDNIDTRERAEGVESAIRDCGREVQCETHFAESYDYESGFAFGMQFAASCQETWRSGLIAASDDLARGAIDALLEQGLDVPERVAVIGFDDSRLARLGRPRLASIRAPLEEIGRVAVRMLLERLGQPESQPAKTILKGRLIVRASCGCMEESPVVHPAQRSRA